MLTRCLLTPSLVLCLLATGTGCGARGAMAGGAILAGAGAMIAYSASSNTSSCADGDRGCMAWDSIVVDPIDKGVEVFGISTLILGAGLFLAGAVKLGAESNDLPARAPTVVVGPPGGSAPIAAAAVVGPHVATPAERAIRARPANQLALQISTIARAGHCDAARQTGDRLRAIDPDLYRTLAQSDAAFADCLAGAATFAP